MVSALAWRQSDHLSRLLGGQHGFCKDRIHWHHGRMISGNVRVKENRTSPKIDSIWKHKRG